MSRRQTSSVTTVVVWLSLLLFAVILVSTSTGIQAKPPPPASASANEEAEEEAEEAAESKPVERPGTEHRPSHTDKEGHHDDDFDHEAVIGSKEESEKFKALAPEEAKKRLSVFVKKMDQNNNGTVELKEMEDWIINSFRKLDEEKAKKKFGETDENKDGSVTWDEILHREYGYKEKELEEMSSRQDNETKSFLQVVKDDKIKFQFADVNKDGKLDQEEFRAFVAPHNFNHMSLIEAQKLMHQYDLNKDGFLTKEEFLSDTNKADANETEAETQHFLTYDVNKDGKLDQQELVPWVTSGLSENARYEAEHLLEEADANKDGILSEDEILQQSDLFVGSQATDYGKHLMDLERLKEL